MEESEIIHRTKSSHIITFLCKYAFVAGIIIFIVFGYSYTSTADREFSKVESSLRGTLNTENMKNVSDRGLNRYYGFNAADYSGVMMYISSNAMSAEEILLIKVNDESQINELEKAINDRVKSRKKDFDGYAPEQAELLKNSEIIIRGKYIFFVASENADAYRKAFLDSV